MYCDTGEAAGVTVSENSTSTVVLERIPARTLVGAEGFPPTERVASFTLIRDGSGVSAAYVGAIVDVISRVLKARSGLHAIKPNRHDLA